MAKARFSGFKLMDSDMLLVDKLSEPHRQVLLLIHANETISMMAANLSVAEGTIKSRTNRARAALQALRDEALEFAQTVTR